MEISENGKRGVEVGGRDRRFVEDGDEIVMKGYAEKDGVRVGFGECRSRILKRE